MTGVEWLALPVLVPLAVLTAIGAMLFFGGLGDREPGFAAVGAVVTAAGVWAIVSALMLAAAADGRLRWELREQPDGSRDWVRVWADEPGKDGAR